MELKERLRRAANLFVAIPEEAPPRDDDAAPADTTDEPADETAPRPTRTMAQTVYVTGDRDAVPLTDAGEDFSSIYVKAGLPLSQFSAEQAVEMVRSLPPELPLPMKRQTMAVFLNSMGAALGATPETIVADARGKIAVLAAYCNSQSEQTGATLARTNQEIADLQALIEVKRGEIARAQELLAQVLKRCHDEADRLDNVLEFFGLDAPPARRNDAA